MTNKRDIHCSYCRKQGHTISNCDSEEVKKIYDEIDYYAGITYLFPSIKYVLITSEIEKLIIPEMKTVLFRYFILTPIEKKIKNRKDIIKLLSDNYYVYVEKNEENDNYWKIYINNILIPNEASLSKFRDIIDKIKKLSPDNLEEILEEINVVYVDIQNKIEEERIKREEIRRQREEVRRQREEEHRQREIIKLRELYKFDIEIISLYSKNPDKTFDCSIFYTDEIPEREKIQFNKCKHAFCGSCITNYLENLQIQRTKILNCPYCRKKVEGFQIKNKELCETISNKFCKSKHIRFDLECRWIDWFKFWIPFK